jgi:hypothetical protein
VALPKIAALRFRLPASLLVALSVAALLAGARLAQHALWDDEAYTAIFARNLLHTGTLTAWDGHNLMVYRGGATLDQHLIETENPPLQFYLAAGSMAVLGETTLAARLPFVVLGLLALVAVYAWTRCLAAEDDMPAWLPVWLLALNVPFLLNIAQSRYYAPVLLLTPTLLLCQAACTGARRAAWFAAGAAAAVALTFAHYIAGAALSASLLAVSLLPAPHRRTRIAFAAMVCALIAAVLAWVLLRRGLLAFWQRPHGATGMLPHFLILFGRELPDLGWFGFFPVLPVPLLAAPWLVPRLAELRPLARSALGILAMMVVALAVTAFASPQETARTHYADMRYALEILVMGAVPTAVAIWVLARWAGGAAAAGLAAFVLLTNLAFVPSWPPQCILCDRVGELMGHHPSGTDALLLAAQAVPAGALTMVVPDYMTLPLMFYRPDLRFANLLDPAHPIDPALRATLPKWVFQASTPPDAVLRGIMEPPSPGLRAAGAHLSLTAIEPYFWTDVTRPDLPGHRFAPDPELDAKFGWALYQRDISP